jgi:hypothetical protein
LPPQTYGSFDIDVLRTSLHNMRSADLNEMLMSGELAALTGHMGGGTSPDQAAATSGAAAAGGPPKFTGGAGVGVGRQQRQQAHEQQQAPIAMATAAVVAAAAAAAGGAAASEHQHAREGVVSPSGDMRRAGLGPAVAPLDLQSIGDAKRMRSSGEADTHPTAHALVGRGRGGFAVLW